MLICCKQRQLKFHFLIKHSFHILGRRNVEQHDRPQHQHKTQRQRLKPQQPSQRCPGNDDCHSYGRQRRHQQVFSGFTAEMYRLRLLASPFRYTITLNYRG